MRWLALDVGAKRVGVAISDSEERVVTPQSVMPFTSPHALAQRVKELVALWGVDAVLVGVPVTRGGRSRGEARVNSVVVQLKKTLAVPVTTWDERGTSREAEVLLAQHDVPSKRRREKLDALAAALLLESFLVLHRQRAADDLGG